MLKKRKEKCLAKNKNTADRGRNTRRDFIKARQVDCSALKPRVGDATHNDRRNT